jgi:hypothetical protein
VRRALPAALAWFMLLVAACGGDDPSERRATGPAPHLDPVELHGPLPGKPAEGVFRDEKGRLLSEVHELVFAERGTLRVELLLGRQGGVPCIGARLAHTRSAELDCFEPWENPPLVARVVVGGETRRRTDWLAVLGITQKPTSRLILHAQAGNATTLTLRAWPGFPWRAFATITEAGNLGNTLAAHDADGDALAQVQLSFAYNPPCLQGNDDVCARTPPIPGSWSETRDPVRAASGTGLAASEIAFGHPAIRRLAAGRTFFVNPTAMWQKCNGDPLGAHMSLRFWPAISFEGEIPIHARAEGGEDVAYREGRAHVEAENITAVDVWVDLNRRRVVGVDLEALKPHSSFMSEQKDVSTEIDEWDVLEEPKPAGGHDDADACPKHEFGD